MSRRAALFLSGCVFGLALLGCRGMQGNIMIGIHMELPLQLTETEPLTIRAATFNVSLSGKQAGDIRNRLATPHDLQAQNIAAILQHVRPDIVLLNELDYDASGEIVEQFQRNYLAISQREQKPIRYPHVYVVPSNTGVPSGMDLDHDGRLDGAGDAFGYGAYAGQYAFVLLSQFEIQQREVRSFRNFLWRDMPNARLPQTAAGEPWYTPEELSQLRLSSKNHIDLPLQVHGQTIHILAAHPTPPVFDGPEDRNGLRNHDEIRLWADYLHADERAHYLRDDNGKRGGLGEEKLFVVLGDLNADPVDGDSTDQAIRQLLNHQRIHPSVLGDRRVPRSEGGAEQKTKKPAHLGDPAEDTASWGLRVDYVLPARELEVLDSGVFWPKSSDPKADWLRPSSDHRLVWLDLQLP
jgi:endonuclease/exonuclease/phosphatase family metal-dependent hydrolase